MEKLNPCPNCNGKGKLTWGPYHGNSRINPPKDRSQNAYFALVQCLNCEFKTSTFKPQEGKTSKGKNNKGKGKGKTKIDVNELKQLAIAEWNNLSSKGSQSQNGITPAQKLT